MENTTEYGRYQSNYINKSMNISGLNALNKRQRLSEHIKKQDPNTRCLRETHFIYKDTQIKRKGMQKIQRANNNHEKLEVSVLITDTADFRERKTIRDKEKCYIKIKKSVFQKT